MDAVYLHRSTAPWWSADLALLFRLSTSVRRNGSAASAAFTERGGSNLWQIMTVVVVVGLLLHAASTPAPDEGGALPRRSCPSVSSPGSSGRWCNEFVFLMGLRDDDFPGRNDKLIWAVVLAGLRADQRLVLPVVSPGPLARAQVRARAITPSPTAEPDESGPRRSRV